MGVYNKKDESIKAFKRNQVFVAIPYGKRWGIETSLHEEVAQDKDGPKELSGTPIFFPFSVVLYNLWVLINAFVEAFIFKRALRKPCLTATMFEDDPD
ncbi:MAG: hypothetical protein V3T58_02230 [Candidatus Hydrothermarchaeales archaeon]